MIVHTDAFANRVALKVSAKCGIALMSILLLMNVSIRCYGQAYIADNSIGTMKREKVVKFDVLAYRPKEKLVGEKFIMLPVPKDRQSYNYTGLSYRSAKPYNTLPYNLMVGKILTMTSFEGMYGYFTDDRGIEYKSLVTNEVLSDMGSVRDIDSARVLYLGKTLWVKDDEPDTYDDETDKFGKVKNTKLRPVKVVNIVAGWYDFSPVRFIVESTDKRQGFIDVNMSGTNTSSPLRDGALFSTKFFTKDPKTIYKFSPVIWNKIQRSLISIGMTKKQVELSWGKPDRVNRSTYASGAEEQWVYGEDSSKYVYFRNGIMTAQN